MQLAGLLGLDEFPTRMECFDNSHIMGTDTVSSMVVFTDGRPDKNAYRRFRIRSEAGGDDLIAMEEVLTRRFKKGPPRRLSTWKRRMRQTPRWTCRSLSTPRPTWRSVPSTGPL